MNPKHRIRNELKAQGHTYESLGNEIGITHQAVSKIVNGRTTRGTARYALAKALQRNVNELWPEEA